MLLGDLRDLVVSSGVRGRGLGQAHNQVRDLGCGRSVRAQDDVHVGLHRESTLAWPRSSLMISGDLRPERRSRTAWRMACGRMIRAASGPLGRARRSAVSPRVECAPSAETNSSRLAWPSSLRSSAQPSTSASSAVSVCGSGVTTRCPLWSRCRTVGPACPSTWTRGAPSETGRADESMSVSSRSASSPRRTPGVATSIHSACERSTCTWWTNRRIRSGSQTAS